MIRIGLPRELNEVSENRYGWTPTKIVEVHPNEYALTVVGDYEIKLGEDGLEIKYTPTGETGVADHEELSKGDIIYFHNIRQARTIDQVYESIQRYLRAHPMTEDQAYSSSDEGYMYDGTVQPARNEPFTVHFDTEAQEVVIREFGENFTEFSND